jgi:hypothetical protein
MYNEPTVLGQAPPVTEPTTMPTMSTMPEINIDKIKQMLDKTKTVK